MSDHHHSKESGEALSAWLKANPGRGNIRQLGEALGINYSALRHYFAGHNFPRGDALTKLRDLTQLPILDRAPARRSRTRAVEATRPQIYSVPERLPAQSTQGASPVGDKGDPRRVKLLVALRTWIGQHPEVGRSGLARALGVSERTVQAWVTGRYYPDPVLQKEIARVTGVSFGPDGPTLSSSVAPSLPASTKSVPSEAEAAAEALLHLLRVLEPVVQGPPARRKALQQAFSREGAGYLTAALTALYSSEEDFQTWKYFAHPRTGESK
jgi:transcriptional regulator with XRE-family HTH domain